MSRPRQRGFTSWITSSNLFETNIIFSICWKSKNRREVYKSVSYKKKYSCWVHYFQYCSYSMSNTKIHTLRYLYILAYNNTICIMYSFYSAARMMKACSIRKLPSISHFIMCWITILATSLLTTHTYQLYQLIISMCLIHFMQNQLQLGLMPKFLNGKYCQMPSHQPWYVPHTYIHHLLPLPQRRFRIRQASLPSILLLLWSLHLFLPLNQQWTL